VVGLIFRYKESIMNMDNIDYYDKRILKLLDKVESAILFNDENIYYFTGFYAKDSKSILIVCKKEIVLLVNFIYLEEAINVLKDKDIKIIRVNKERIKEAADIVRDHNIKVLSMEFSSINHSDFLNLNNRLKKLKIKTINADDHIRDLRIIKDEIELEKILKAARITDDVFHELTEKGIDYFHGKNELILSLEIESLMIKKGAQGKSFECVVAYKKNSSKPHYHPSKENITKGIILLDFGSKYGNYNSDITRTFFLKDPGDFKKIYEIVLNAQLIAIENVKEGITAKEVDDIARNYIKSKGYGDYFGHGLGHGVGLNVHEEPYLNNRSSSVLKENMVITIEPGIYIKDKGGIRIEDMVIVKKKSCINLFRSQKNIIQLS
jgi:Xaa-Pro aminopeptidase